MRPRRAGSKQIHVTAKRARIYYGFYWISLKKNGGDTQTRTADLMRVKHGVSNHTVRQIRNKRSYLSVRLSPDLNLVKGLLLCLRAELEMPSSGRVASHKMGTLDQMTDRMPLSPAIM